MADLIGGNILIDRAEYEHLKLKAELGECLLHYLLRRHADDLWSKETRDLMDECSLAFWGETVDWQLDEEENEDD